MKKVVMDIIVRFKKDDIPALGAQVAYNLILSFFPFIIFLMTLIGYTFLNRLEVINEISSLFPQSISELIKYTVLDVRASKNNSVMSLSLIFTLWSASSGFNAVIKGLNKAYGVRETRSFVKLRIVSLLCTLGMSIIIIIMMVLLVLGTVIWNAVTRRFYILHELTLVWVITKYLIVVSTTIFIFSLLYRYAPNRKLRWIEVCYGAIFSTGSLILVSAIFAYYVNNFGKYSMFYGSIGAIIFLLIWLFLVSIIIILGGELNASLVSRGSDNNKRRFKVTNNIKNL